MVVPIVILTKRSKRVATKKKKSFEKVSLSKKEPYVHVHKHVESMNIAKEVDFNTTEKIIDHTETTIKEPRVESHIDSHVKPNVETFVPASGEPQVEPPIEPAMDIPLFDTRIDDTSSEYLSDVEPHHVEVESQSKKGGDKKSISTFVVDSYLDNILNENHKSNEELGN